MKKETKTNLRRHAILLAGIATLLFASCEANDVYNPDAAEKTSELTAPSGFNWKTTTTANLTVTAGVDTYVSVYTDKTCTDNSLLIENAAVKAGTPLELALHIPTAQTAVYVKYPVAADRNEVAEVQLGTTRAGGVLNLPTDHTSSFPLGTSWYYPSQSDYGTLMFEDLYPALGDYDFNDLVVRYNAQFRTLGDLWGKDGANFTFTFKICAAGGVRNYTPMLRLKGFKMSNLKDATVEFATSYQGIEMKLVEGRSDDQDVIFAIIGIDLLRANGFFNTDPDKTHSEAIPTLTCKVSYQGGHDESWDYYDLKYYLPEYFDFFLSNEQNEEIHFCDFQPTDMSGMDKDTKFRYPQQNLVWAMGVPTEISYPQEGVDILEVFGEQFKQWVTSGGQKNADWYKNPVNGDKLY